MSGASVDGFAWTVTGLIRFDGSAFDETNTHWMTAARAYGDDDAPSDHRQYLQTRDGSVGWFTCADAILDSVPTTMTGLNAACKLNGIAWSYHFTNEFFFTASEFETHALAVTAPFCTSERYNTIC